MQSNDSLIDLKAAYLTLETFAYTKGAGGDVWDALRNMSKAAAMGEAKPEKHDPRAPMMALASPASDCQSEISNNSDWQKIDDVLHEASRLIDYFANGKTLFVGSGTPVGCLERINHALNLVAAMRKPEPVSVSLEKCAKPLFDDNPCWSWEKAIIQTKAVLDAAGVKYVD